jgi:molybdopterin/thiamine biosynthesis adenylyltransferase
VPDARQFPYDLAFDRNLGWITDWEQLALRSKRVAIAGMGGVGGLHLLTLARLGVGGFSIADFDQFEFANFNRQIGATTGSVGRDKIAVMAEMALAINPELHMRRFDAGVLPETLDDFLDGADLFVDGLDFFELRIRRRVFARCAELGIPSITAAPIGMGASLIAFDPKGMSFEQYFRLEGRPEAEQYVRFLLGLAPRALHQRYFVDPTRVDLVRRKVPSTVVGCQLCAGVAAAAAIKLLLGRVDVMPAPYNHQFDPYRARFCLNRLAFGNAGPLQRLKIAIGRRAYARPRPGPPVAEPPATARSPIEEILNLARWAPSGDNSQPWTFKLLDPETVLVRIRHDSDNLYNYRDGEPTWLSAGMLIESMRIAASMWQREMVCEPSQAGSPDRMTIRFQKSDRVTKDPLSSFLTLRSVDRHCYRRRALSASEEATLEACVPNDLRLDWHDGMRQRWCIARLSGTATSIRLRCPEAFAVHQRMIDWQRAQSPSGIPAGAVGLSRPTLWLMNWSMRRWQRTRWLNRLGGTLVAAWQLDYLPGLNSGAYFVLRCPATIPIETASTALLIERGRCIQRFWLTAAQLGLAMQPLLAIIAFAHYGNHRIRFSSELSLLRRAATFAASFARTFRAVSDEVIFIGRIGEPYPRLPRHRSIRRPLVDLMD